MIKRLVLPVFVVVFAYIGIVLVCGSTAWLHFDGPSLVIVPVLPLLYMAGIYGFGGLASAFRSPFFEAATAKDLALAASFFKDLGKAFWLFGVMGLGLGLIEVLRNLTEPKKLGPNLAIAILTVLYAATFNLLIAHPFAAQARKRLAEAE